MYVRWCFFIILFNTISTFSYAETVYVNGNLQNIEIRKNTEITENSTVHNINIAKAVNINNKGVITGLVQICRGCDVNIENSGFINAVFDVPNGSMVNQIIHDESDINLLGITNNFQIKVENSERISLSKLKSISNLADKIIINDSGLDLGSKLEDTKAFPPNMELRGNITLYIDDLSIFDDKPVLSNVSGNGTIIVKSDEVNPLYRFSSFVSDNNLYISMLRDTDYVKILDDKIGSFLNEIRLKNPSDKLLGALDNAQSMSEIKDLISKSVRLNPIRLMDAVRTFNTFEVNKFASDINGLGFSPMFIFSNSFNISGATADVGYSFTKDLRIGVSGYAAKINFADNIDEYEGFLYGGNIRISYKNGFILSRILAGLTQANFKIDSIFDGETALTNPEGKSFYSFGDIGVNFDVLSNLSISPFIRIGLNSAEIANATDTGVLTGIGTDLFLMTDTYDIKYKYGINISAYTNGIVNAMFQVDMMSVADGAGGNIQLGIVCDEFENFSYKVGITAGLKF